MNTSFFSDKLASRALVLVCVVQLAACASTSPVPVVDRSAGKVETPLTPVTRPVVAPSESAVNAYTVKKGDTLYGIALDHGLDYKDIVAWNALENPNLIQVGQSLRLAAPGAVATGGVITRPVAAPAAIEVRPIKSGSDGGPAGAVSLSTEAVKRDPKGGKQPYSPEALESLRKAEGGKMSEPVATTALPAVAPAVAPAVVPAVTTAPAASPSPAVSTGVDWMWPLGGSLLAPFAEGSTKGIDIAGKIGDPISAAAAGKVVYAGSGLRGYGKLVIVRHSSDYLSAYAHASQLLVKEGQLVTRGQKIAEVGDTDADRPKLHFEVRFQGKPVDPQKHLPPR